MIMSVSPLRYNTRPPDKTTISMMEATYQIGNGIHHLTLTTFQWYTIFSYIVFCHFFHCYKTPVRHICFIVHVGILTKFHCWKNMSNLQRSDDLCLHLFSHPTVSMKVSFKYNNFTLMLLQQDMMAWMCVFITLLHLEESSLYKMLASWC